MAVTEVVDFADWDGYQGRVRWRGTWPGTEDLTDTVLADISGLGAAGASAPTSIKIQRVQAVINGDITVTLEFDASTDQIIDQWSGQSDVTNQIVVDYTGGPNKGVVGSDTAAAGWTGDLLLTTSGGAAGDEVNLTVDFARSR